VPSHPGGAGGVKGIRRIARDSRYSDFFNRTNPYATFVPWLIRRKSDAIESNRLVRFYSFGRG
jgi:hypothetical protein